MRQKICISVVLPLKLEWLPRYFVKEEDIKSGLIAKGTRVRVIFANKEYIGAVYETEASPDTDESKIKDIICVETKLSPVSDKEIELWKFVSSYYLCRIGEVYKAAYPSQRINDEKVLAALIEKKEEKRKETLKNIHLKIEKYEGRLIKKQEALLKARQAETKRKYEQAAEKIRIEIHELKNKLAAIEVQNKSEKEENPKIILSEAQQKAYDYLKEIFKQGRPALLKGLSGSGKTEIYIKMAAEVLNRGLSVLYMIPEIALGHQLEKRLGQAFGNRLLTVHSGKTQAQKREAAQKLRNGVYILLGTRSSVFLPYKDLGLIIVDEEHDTSYKQDSPSPRYNGRDTAIMLGKLHNCPVLLGSATPSLESIYNCKTERYGTAILEERFYKSSPVKVEIIDTKAERRKRGMNGRFSLKLIHRIRQTLDSGGQAMILHGKKAYSPIVQCEECGDIPKCPHCNVSLSYHKSSEALICHYCGHKEAYTGRCKKCGGEAQALGAGTERIEEEAASLFPDAVIARLDGEVSKNRSVENKIIKDFEEGKTNLLIGTRILTKGFDFKDLTLVAAIQADSITGVQDFRADEKALQMLEQFRGRCGRRNKNGIFIIQTSQPEHPVYKHLAYYKSDEDMINVLLNERRLFLYPPFSRIINIIIKDSNLIRLEALSSRLAKGIAELFSVRPSYFEIPAEASVCVTGPYSPTVDKIANEYIRHIRLLMKKNKDLHYNKKRLFRYISDFEKEKSYISHINIDVDPA